MLYIFPQNILISLCKSHPSKSFVNLFESCSSESLYKQSVGRIFFTAFILHSSFHKHFTDSKPSNSYYWTEQSLRNKESSKWFNPDQRGTPAREKCMESNRPGPLRNKIKSSEEIIFGLAQIRSIHPVGPSMNEL